MYSTTNKMTKLEKIIRYRLYKEITLRNISLESLSSRIGLPRNHLSIRLKSSYRGGLDIGVIISICKELGIPLYKVIPNSKMNGGDLE